MSYICPPNGPTLIVGAASNDPYVSWQRHIARGSAGGVDLVAPVGTPIYAPADGTVRRLPNNGSGGPTIVLDQANGWSDWFLHLSRFHAAHGARVKQGALLGYTGDEPNVAPHLHWHRLKGGKRFNPYNYFDYTMGFTSVFQKHVQGILDRVGLYDGPHDGIFGWYSIRALQIHLKRTGALPGGYTVDGIVGPTLRAAALTLQPQHAPPLPAPPAPVEPAPLPEPAPVVTPEPVEPEPITPPVEPLPEFPEPSPVEPGQPEPPLQHAKPAGKPTWLTVLIGSAIALLLGVLGVIFGN